MLAAVTIRGYGRKYRVRLFPGETVLDHEQRLRRSYEQRLDATFTYALMQEPHLESWCFRCHDYRYYCGNSFDGCHIDISGL